MDDGLVLVATNSEIMLINIKENNFEIIQSLKTELYKVFKLTNEKFLAIEKDKSKGNIYIYKNKYLEFKKQISLKYVNNMYWFDNICILNEKELIIYFCNIKKLIGYNLCVYVIDLEKDKKIKSLYLNWFLTLSYDLIYDKALIVGGERKLLIIDLTNYSKKKEFTLPNKGNIHSIIALNEKQFIVGQYDCLSQFELDKDYKFKLICHIGLKSNYICKYPKSRFLIRPSYEGNKILSLYC